MICKSELLCLKKQEDRSNRTVKHLSYYCTEKESVLAATLAESMEVARNTSVRSINQEVHFSLKDVLEVHLVNYPKILYYIEYCLGPKYVGGYSRIQSILANIRA